MRGLTGTTVPDVDEVGLESVLQASQMAERMCSRGGLQGADAEDFVSWVRLRLLADDFAIVRRCASEDTKRGFLRAVVSNLLRDYRNMEWGKWRPSAAAKRLGPIAVSLECSVYRDGMPLTAAITQLQAQGYDVSLRECARLLDRLPRRIRPKSEGPEPLRTLRSRHKADDRLLASERARSRGSVTMALRAALSSLSVEDRELVDLRYCQGRSVAEIARSLGLDQKPLYRRIERILVALRESKHLSSIHPEDIEDIVE